MTASALIKSVSAAVAALITYLFPTQVLITMWYCLIALWIIDAITGIQAAVEEKQHVTVEAFIGKAGKKFIRGVSYLGLAWVSGQMASSVIGTVRPISEPMGFVMGILVATDALSILRNLARSHNNIPILDSLLSKLFENIRDQKSTPSQQENTQP